MKEKTENELLIKEATAQLKRLFLLVVSLFTMMPLLFAGGTGIITVAIVIFSGNIFQNISVFIKILTIGIISGLSLYLAHKLLVDFFLPQGEIFIDTGTKRALKSSKSN